MILTALTQYYQRLLENPDVDSGLPRVPSYGFSEERIGYILILSQDGNVVDVQNNIDTSGKKPMPKLTGVPQPVKRTSGVKSNFLWDKTAYVLGVESNKDKASVKEIPWVSANKTFEAFKQLHLETLADVEDIGLVALKLFLERWQPKQFDQVPFSPEMIDANIAFKLDGDNQFLHDRLAAKLIWAKLLAPNEDAIESTCLVTGKIESIARLHPAIKGVYGGQSSGGSIVSFNADAYTSYGKSQGENAPVSESAAFAYTTALNYLLRRENRQCLSIGDTSTVFWAIANDKNSALEAESLFGWMVNMPINTDDSERAQIKPILDKIAQGRPLTEFAPDISPNTHFYVLGLSPNASRLSIRYWMDTTFGELAEHVQQHFIDLEISPNAWRDPPSIWRLLIQTAAQGKSENIHPQLAGELMRSILTGQAYPRMLLSQLTQRIRADGDISGIRIALIKAVIQRDYRKGLIQEEVPMALDLNSKNAAYLLGRLFATIERVQEAALGRDVNSTVADRYYGSAASVPFSVFPRLLAGSQNHLTKIRRDKPGFAVNLKKDLTGIIAGLDDAFPKHLSIEEQGRFAVGYYHQKQSYFESKDKSSEELVNENTALVTE